MKYFKYYLISLVAIILDQVSKMLVHFNMDLGVIGEVPVIGNWFILHYTLNPGMAFGMELGGEYGKLILTIFRLFAMVGIAYYVYLLIKKEVHTGLICCVALILGGAVGNVIDSTFYGVLLDNAPYNAPTPWFYGQVVDMLYFPLIEGYYPDWFPFWAGEKFLFFRPVFNIADSSIFIGVATILSMQKSFFAHEKKEDELLEADLDGLKSEAVESTE